MKQSTVEKMVADAGYRLGWSYEDEARVYACSFTSKRGTHGQPEYELIYDRASDSLQETGERLVPKGGRA